MENSKRKILLVDDDQSLLDTLGDFLSFEGYEVLCASSGEDALVKMRPFKPDLIILDVMLGSDNGPDVYSELLDRGLNPDIPLVMLTALAASGDEKPLKPGKKQALYAKPVTPSVFIHDISEYLKAA